MIDPALRDIVHPRALYERSPLPDSQNALAAWQAAGAAMVNVEELDALAEYGSECGCTEEECATSAPPSPVEFVARAGELLSANREARQHLKRVLEIGRLQVTISPPSMEAGLPYDAVRNSARLLAVQGKRFALLGDWPNAVAAHLQILKLGAMYGNCEGGMVNWLVALAVQGIAVWQLSELVDQDLTPAVKHDIAQALPLKLGRESGARAMQSEFTSWALPFVQPFLKLSSEEALQKVLETFYAENTDDRPTPEIPWDSRTWSREMQSTIPMLLGDHRQLWDAQETVRSLSIDYAAAVAEWLEDHELRESIRPEYETWAARREGFAQSFPPQCISFFGAVDVDHPGKFKPVSARQFAEARIALRSITNPLGLRMACEINPGVGPGILTANAERSAREAHLRAAVANA